MPRTSRREPDRDPARCLRFRRPGHFGAIELSNSFPARLSVFRSRPVSVDRQIVLTVYPDVDFSSRRRVLHGIDIRLPLTEHWESTRTGGADTDSVDGSLGYQRHHFVHHVSSQIREVDVCVELQLAALESRTSEEIIDADQAFRRNAASGSATSLPRDRRYRCQFCSHLTPEGCTQLVRDK